MLVSLLSQEEWLDQSPNVNFTKHRFCCYSFTNKEIKKSCV